MAVQDDQAQANLSALAVRTRKSLNRLETLVGEAARERRSRLTDMPDPEPLLRTLMRLRHDVVMVRRAVGEPGLEVLSEHPAQTWASAARAGAATLGKLADALSAGQSPAPSDAMADAIGAYRASIDELRRSKRTRILPTDALADVRCRVRAGAVPPRSRRSGRAGRGLRRSPITGGYGAAGKSDTTKQGRGR